MGRLTRNLCTRSLPVWLLACALAAAGVVVGAAPLPPASGQSYSVAGTILGLAIIAGAIYLIARDHDGRYHRYPFGRYEHERPHYVYSGPYALRYREYENRFYAGPLPRRWRADECAGGPPWAPHCRRY